MTRSGNNIKVAVLLDKSVEYDHPGKHSPAYIWLLSHNVIGYEDSKCYSVFRSIFYYSLTVFYCLSNCWLFSHSVLVSFTCRHGFTPVPTTLQKSVKFFINKYIFNEKSLSKLKSSQYPV